MRISKLLKQNHLEAQLKSFLHIAVEDGVLDPSNVVHDYVTDPFPVEDFTIKKPVAGSFKNIELTGLRDLKIEEMKLNLGLMKMKVDMVIPLVRIEGLYALNGRIAFFPIHGGGDFWMNVSHLQIFAKTGLIKNKYGQLIVSDIELDVENDDIELHFDNLGSQRLSFVMNSILNKLSGLIFNQIKDLVLNGSEGDIKRHINAKLKQLPDAFISGKSEFIFDDLLAKTKLAIKSSGFDPFPLPDTNKSFARSLHFLTFRGDLKLYNGTLYGISTLIRTGDLIATYKDNYVTLEASLGFDNLTGQMNWSASIMDAGPAGTASLAVSQISAYLKIRQHLSEGSPPELHDFKIENINYLWINVRGLGTMDFLLEFIINLISNLFKGLLRIAISGPIKDVVQNELNQMPLTFL